MTVEWYCLHIMSCTYDNVAIALNISIGGDESTPKGVPYCPMKVAWTMGYQGSNPCSENVR